MLYNHGYHKLLPLPTQDASTITSQHMCYQWRIIILFCPRVAKEKTGQRPEMVGLRKNLVESIAEYTGIAVRVCFAHALLPPVLSAPETLATS